MLRGAALAAKIEHVDAAGYGIQRDLTWNAHRQGYTIVEEPITFVERERGSSKLGKDVFVEALAKTTSMGLEFRVGEAQRALARVTPAARQAAASAGSLLRTIGRTGKHAASDLVRGRRNSG